MPRSDYLVPLKKRDEFLKVAANRKRWISPGFILQVAQRPASSPEAQNQCGFGLTASKKMVGIAVDRNRARRRLRALAKDVLAAHAKPGHNFVLIARKDTLKIEYNEMRGELVKALQRFKLWQDGPS